MSTRIQPLSSAGIRWHAACLAIAVAAGTGSLAALWLRVLSDLDAIMLAVAVLVCSMALTAAVAASAVCLRVEAVLLRWVRRNASNDPVNNER